jgi:hypothetical protein
MHDLAECGGPGEVGMVGMIRVLCIREFLKEAGDVFT